MQLSQNILSISLLLLGSIAGNLLITGYLTYGIPLTAVGLALALFAVHSDRKERRFTEKLADRPAY